MSLINWYSEKIKEWDNVIDCSIINEAIKIKTNNDDYLIGLVNNDEINLEALGGYNIEVLDFILSHKQNPIVLYDTFDVLNRNNCGFGQLGVLQRAIERRDLKHNNLPSMDFVIRGLEQHDKVTSVIKIDSHRLLIKRKWMPSITVLVLNCYKMSGEHVRYHKSIFEKFDVILLSNPYSGSTQSADDIAENIDVSIVKYKQLLGRLNNRKF